MTKRFLLLLLGIGLCWLHAQVPSPTDFLGYELGSRFSWHHQVVDYFEAVAESSPKVKLQRYGASYEGRPLMVAMLTSEENMAELETIRENNLRGVGFVEGPISGKRLPIVWLSYNIHGNESVSTEAAMKTLYHLVAMDTANWLDHVVVIMDPCVNPDGRDRYINWYKQVRHTDPQIDPVSAEHWEPWPGGRLNHYLFDLNRDWAWQSQKESADRSALYQQWFPHVHVDFHEMGAEEPYFFAPAARPLHEAITPWQIEFQHLMGDNHARYFDQNGWRYFTKEVFDLFYPSYGDTWPTYQGAIGVTYEQGGSSRAGLAYLRQTGDTLTLGDRLAHHYTTSISTIETAYRNSARLLKEFDRYFETARRGAPSAYQTFVVSADNPAGKLADLQELLNRHQIAYQEAKGNRSLNAFNFGTQKTGSVSIKKGDWLISTAQPQGNLVRILFEPEPALEDSLTYDLTAWALPYSIGLEAYAVSGVNLNGDEAQPLEMEQGNLEENAYAYLVAWEDIRAAKWLGKMLSNGWKVRKLDAAITLEGKAYAPGTLVALKGENKAEGFEEAVADFAETCEVSVHASKTGLSDAGVDLGSGSVTFIQPPKVALIRGDGISPMRYGELWYYFERELEYPLYTIDLAYLNRVDLSEFDVIVLASGRYGRFTSSLLDYVQQGGRIIATAGAVNVFADNSGGGGTLLSAAVRRREQESGAYKPTDEDFLRPYGETVREYAKSSIPGAVYKVKLDTTHPLAFGLGDTYFTMKEGSASYPYLGEGGWNVGIYPEGKPVSGFAGSLAQEEIEGTMAIGTESMGRGDVVYLVDTPFFRAFWHGGKLLLANAIFF